MQRILIVDDEPGVVDFLRLELELAGCTVETAYTGEEALSRLAAHSFDALLLDVMLPDMDGIALCRRIRDNQDIPILMLTARGATADRVAGLDAGADDYLVKPFAIEELLARLRAVERRRRSSESMVAHVLHVGTITVNLERRRAYCNDQPVELTAREFELLVHFMRHPNQVFTRNELLVEVWGFESPVDTNVVDVYVGYLRQKLDKEKRYLQTVRGMGYALVEAPA
ncbi:MAG: response regulator transcription factor [Alicyclobacillus sp.]|nr:response regulator transcription factor [Alicyclobacillus sp.]